MHLLGKILSPVFKTEIMALHYAHNVVMFFAFLPLLGKETSGREKGPVLEAWSNVLDHYDRNFSRFQMGQMNMLNSLGLLDASFIGKRAKNYIHHAEKKGAPQEKRIDYIIAMNEKGALTDHDAARMISEVGNSLDFAFEYDEKSGGFLQYGDRTQDEIDAQDQFWTKITDWTLDAAARLDKYTGEERKELASTLTFLLQQTPLNESENDIIAVSPRSPDKRESLCVIFKKAVDGQGRPLAATSLNADYLPQMKNWLENDDATVESRKGFSGYLQAYSIKP